MQLKKQWKTEPIQSIPCQPSHDRPVFSLAVGKDAFVTGSADHGLREYNLDNGKHRRELFNKRYGHKEWVSTCFITATGNVLSGAMDSVVCYWQAKAVKCDHFLGHKGSISKVMGDTRLGISASYDASIILWDLSKKSLSEKLVGPHKEAIMDFEWKNSLLVSGDKSGAVAIWDLNNCSPVKAIKGHKGAVSAVKIEEKNGIIITTGLNDGSITGYDMRSNEAIHSEMVHKGSVNWLCTIESNLCATCSADGTIRLLSLPDFQTVKKIEVGDMVFALEEAMGVLVAGTGKGNIHAYDIGTGKCLYGYGVMKNGACRLLGCSQDKSRLVCAGEDNSATLLKY